MKEWFKLGFVLGSITAVCVGLLMMANYVTSPIIQARQDEKQQIIMRRLLPQVERFEEIEQGIYKGWKEELPLGWICEGTADGYGGSVSVWVGFDLEGEIVGVDLFEHHETQGIGTQVAEPMFMDQFQARYAPIETNEVEIVAGATISSRAVVDAINDAERKREVHHESN